MSVAYRRSRYTPTPAGGTAMLGVTVFKFLNVSLSTLSNGKTSGFSGKVLQSIGLGGNLQAILDVIVWFYDVLANISSPGTGSQVVVRVLVRDTTVQPSVTDAQFTDVVNPLIDDGPTFAAAGLFDTANSVGTHGLGVQLAQLFTYANSPATWGINEGDTDSYGNAISKGDAFALDFGIVVHKPVGAVQGTVNATAWVTAMFT